MLAAVAAALIAAQALSPQFDLACTDNRTGEAYRLRLDLDGNRWCEGDCLQTRPIAEVTADRYTLFRYEPTPGSRLRTSGLSYIDRQTGEHWEQRLSAGALTQVERREGRCERAVFSGMPEPRL
jgi:hypothetical protein